MSRRSAAETVGKIYWAFLESQTWRQADLARRVGVSTRALRARLDELSSDLRLECDDEPPDMMWSVPKGWFPQGVALTQEEVGQILRFIARAERSPTRDSLMRRLVRASALKTTEPNRTEMDGAEPILAVLEDGLEKHAAVRMLYVTAQTGIESWRHVSVQRVAYGAKTRFVGYCHKARDLRWFRVSRVREARLDQSMPYVRAELARVDGLLTQSVDGWADGGPPVRVSFVVVGDDARWVPGSLPCEGLAVDTCDGGVRIHGTTGGLKVLARFVAGLGGAALVETSELGERVQELAIGTLARTSVRVTAHAPARARARPRAQAEHVTRVR
jgi:predicted DNA-binding transcriptional regulator YafY